MTHHTDAELLPCPFCGASPKIEGQGAVRWIKCPDDSACGSGGMAIGIPTDDLARGIASWNRRAPAAPVPQGWKPVPVELLERIQESLGSFVSDQGWSQSDMDTADALDGLLAAAPQPPEAAPVEFPEPVAYRLRNTAFRSEVYEYFRTKYLAECRQKQFNASVDDGGLHELTPIYTEQQVRQLLANHGIQEQST